MARISFSGKNLLRYFIFFVVITIIFYAIPKGGRFKFEYKEQGLWKHEDLISPIQFSVKKTEDEINTEKEEIRKNFKPLFNKDPEIVQRTKTEFIRSIKDLVNG